MEKKKQRRPRTRKKLSLSLTAVFLLLVVLLGSTYAWLTYQDERVNVMGMGDLTDGNVYLEEEFKTITNWQMGVEHPKKARVVNAGITPVLTRVSYEEYLQYYDRITEAVLLPLDTTSPTTRPTGYYWAPVNYESYTEEDGWYELDLTQAKTAITNFPTTITTTNFGIKIKVVSTEPTKVETIATFHKSNLYLGRSPYFLSFNLNVTSEEGIDLTNWKYTINGDVKGWFIPLSEGTITPNRFIGKDWAGENVVLGTTVSGEKTSTGEAMHYFHTKDTEVTLASGNQIPHEDPKDSTRWIANVQADDVLNSSLYMFGDIATFAKVPNASNKDKWFYNEKDGYFYYLSLLDTGETTTDFLSGVGLSATAGGKYSNADFHLIPTMEAIEATREAIVGESGWHLPAESELTTYLLTLLDE